jgi:hypothetical protein
MEPNLGVAKRKSVEARPELLRGTVEVKKEACREPKKEED